MVEELSNPVKGRAGNLASGERKSVFLQVRVKANGGMRFQTGKIHREGTVAGQTQLLITIAPILNEGDIRMRDRADWTEIWTFHT